MLRFVNLGLVHQSNGGGSSLSRSWNRLYVPAGVERGDLQLVARAWKRINEDANNDDNPRIADYMGHGDLTASYRRRGHEFSLLTKGISYCNAEGKGGIARSLDTAASPYARRRFDAKLLGLGFRQIGKMKKLGNRKPSVSLSTRASLCLHCNCGINGGKELK